MGDPGEGGPVGSVEIVVWIALARPGAHELGSEAGRGCSAPGLRFLRVIEFYVVRGLAAAGRTGSAAGTIGELVWALGGDCRMHKRLRCCTCKSFFFNVFFKHRPCSKCLKTILRMCQEKGHMSVFLSMPPQLYNYLLPRVDIS